MNHHLRHRLRYAAATLLGVFFCCGLWTLQGVDLTDEGFSLTNQMLMFDGSRKYEYGMIWLSDCVGGLWLWVTGDPGLWSARLGWALIVALTACVAFFLLSEVFPARAVMPAVVVTALATNCEGILVITYKTVPILLLTVACGCLFAAHDPYLGPRSRAAAALAGGCFLALTFMAKFPMVLAFGFPLLGPLVHMMIGRRSAPHWRSAAISYAGLLLGLAGLTSGLSGSGHLDQYLDVLRGTSSFGGDYSVRELVEIYLEDTLLSTTYLVNAVVLLAIVMLAARGWAESRGAPRSGPRVAFPVLLVLALAVGMYLGPLHWTNYVIRVIPGFAWAACAAVLVHLLRRGGRGARHGRRLHLVVMALCVPPVAIAGSLGGVREMLYALWLPLPIALLMLPRALAGASRWRWFREGGQPADFAPYVIIAAGLLAATGIGTRFVNARRDLVNRLDLDTMPAHPRLWGIHTSPQRARSIESVLSAIEQRVRPGDVILNYNNVPMVHYLTRTRPAMVLCWTEIIPQQIFRDEVEELVASGNVPRLVVRAKVNPRDRRWAVRNAEKLSRHAPESLHTMEMLDARLSEAGFQPVWSNPEFVILASTEPPTVTHTVAAAPEPSDSPRDGAAP